MQEVPYLITDENGLILNGNSKFNSTYIDEENFSFTDSRIFMSDIIQDFKSYSMSDLELGVEAEIKASISGSDFSTNYLTSLY